MAVWPTDFLFYLPRAGICFCETNRQTIPFLLTSILSRIHPDPTKKDFATRDIIRKAYEYALNSASGIGQDKDSGDIWLDYIQFLSEAEVCCTTVHFDSFSPPSDNHHI